MAVKSGTLTFDLDSGKSGGIKAYLDWSTELISDNTYTLYVTMYGATDGYNSRTCWYHFYLDGQMIIDSNIKIASGGYFELYSNSFTITVSDSGTYNGSIGGAFGYYSDTYGDYARSGTISNFVAGNANYKIYYRSNYGSAGIFKTASGYDVNDTCRVISDIPTRSSSTSNSTFTITGNANGGDANTSCTATKTVVTTYKFSGWNTKSDGTGTSYSSGGTFTVTGNTNLYAIWTSSSNTTYSGNTLNSLPKPTRASEGGFYIVTLNSNTNAGFTNVQAGLFKQHTFKGWGSSSSATTTLAYTTSYTANTTVYAIWNTETTDRRIINLNNYIPSRDPIVVESYTVTLNPNGGRVNPTSMVSNKGKSYVFKGWSTVNGSSTNIVSNQYTAPGSAITLYAIWQETNTVDTLSLPIPSYTDFKFLGWTINANSTNYVDMKYIPSQNITLFAIYKPIYTAEIYVYHDGRWRKAKPLLNHENVFNEGVNAI